MSVWTPEVVDRAATMLSAGRSCAFIAKALGVSRNAVVSRVHRDPKLKNLPGRNRANTTPGYMKASNKGAGQSKSSKLVTFGPVRMTRAASIADRLKALNWEDRPEPTVAPTPKMIALVDLSSSDCRWPVGDPLQSDFGFCGHGKLLGSSYCPHHAQRAAAA